MVRQSVSAYKLRGGLGEKGGLEAGSPLLVVLAIIIMNSTPIDTSRLPSYKHSYMLRFHPYPRTGPVRHEPLEALDECDVEQDTDDNPPPGKGDPGQPADEVETLIQTIHPRDKEPDEGKVTRSRRNSLTSQVVDLALLVTRKPT